MAPSSLLLSVGSLIASSLVSATALEARGSQTYQLAESWQGDSFINDWDFFAGSDPTNGYVTYVNQSLAEQSGLVKVTSTGSFYMGVDYQNTLNPNGPGRDSVRIETKNYYTEGLYVIDIEHMPGSICGTWPAFWSVGKDWPNDGEIDIIEGVNLQMANEIVLHTSGTCDVSGSNGMTGSLSSSECGVASGTVGCVVKGTNGSSGTPFNEAGGGVYAMEWTDAFIKIWFFARSQIPASLSSGNPDTTSFGTPMAHLQGSCDFSQRFKAQKFIIDTTFCGDWAGNVFGESGCPMSDPTSPMQSCVNYVAQNPADFKEAYWEINSIKVYQYGVSAASSAAASQATTSTVEGTLVSAQAANTATATVPAAAETTVVSQAAQTNTVAQGTSATDHATHSPAQFTTVPAVTAATAAPTASAAESGDLGLESTSTVYVTSTSTICPVVASSSAAALAGKNAVSSESSGAEVIAAVVATSPIAADAVSNFASATSTTGTVTKSVAGASQLTAGALSEIPTSAPEPVSQAASIASLDESGTAPSNSGEQSSIASASAAPSAIPMPASSGVAALGGSSSASSFTSSRRIPGPTGSSTAAYATAIATWSPTAGGQSASGTGTGSATLNAPIFTPGLSSGANGRSVGISGVIGAMFIAALA